MNDLYIFSLDFRSKPREITGMSMSPGLEESFGGRATATLGSPRSDFGPAAPALRPHAMCHETT